MLQLSQLPVGACVALGVAYVVAVAIRDTGNLRRLVVLMVVVAVLGYVAIVAEYALQQVFAAM
jgi:hypothetical protein